MAGGLELADSRQQVVALDVRDLRTQTQALEQLAQLHRETGRVQTPGVGDDLHAAVDRQARDLLHLAQERGRVAGVRILLARLPEDQHRERALARVLGAEDREERVGERDPHKRRRAQDDRLLHEAPADRAAVAGRVAAHELD